MVALILDKERGVSIVSNPCAKDTAGKNVPQVLCSTVCDGEAFDVNGGSVTIAEMVERWFGGRC
jgi:hypothetical protein